MVRTRRRGTLAAGVAALTAAAIALVGCGTDAQSSSGSSGSASIQIWEGYTGPEATAFKQLVTKYEAAHPTVKISPLYVNNDDTLQKVLTAVRGGSTPDIAYLYGSWAPNVAQIPQVVESVRSKDCLARLRVMATRPKSLN